MALTFVDFTADGSATKAFSFPSYQESDIVVEVDGVVKTVTTHYNLTNYTTTGGGQVVFTTNNIPVSPSLIRIKRKTDVTTNTGDFDPKATFQAGSSIKADDLNNNQKQALFAVGELQEQTIVTTKIKDQAVTTAKIFPDAVDGTKIADDSINSEHYVDGSIDTAHIADLQVTTAKIAADAINGTKIADDSINSEHYVDGSIDTAHIADSQVTTAKIADLNVSTGKLADSGVTTAKIADSSVTTAKIADNAVTMAKLNSGVLPTDITVASANLVDGTIVTADIADSQITTAKIAADAVTNAKIADDSIDSEHYVDGSIDTAHLADSQITTAKIAADAVTVGKIADGELKTLAGMQSGTASVLADSTALTASTAELNQLDGITLETSLTSSDTRIPTSKAVNDQILAVTNALGGFVAIANETSFPAANPDPSNGAGTVVSISQISSGTAVSVNNQGTATISNGAGTGNTVTITGFPSTLQNTNLAQNSGLQVQTTTTLHTYTFHKQLASADDIQAISATVNSFSNRYRVSASAPTSSLDGGDLWYDTTNNKLMVYNSTDSAWEETTAIGNFFISTLSSSSGTGGGSATPNGTAYRFTLSQSAQSAQQLIVSVDGVIQKPNSGTSQPSEGYVIDGNDIIFGSAPVNGASIFITVVGSAVGIGTPSNNTVTTAILQNGSVTTAKIAGDAVDGTKIADDAINSEHYVDGSIDTQHIADLQVTTVKLAADSVTNAKIADDSIDSEHYVDGSIDTAHIGDAQVTEAKIANLAITGTKLSPDIAANKLEVNDAHVIIGDASNDGSLQTLSGDVTMTRTGAVTIANNAVSTVKIADEAVTLAKLPHGTSSNNGKFLRANNGADPTFETVDLSSAFDKGGGDTITGDFTIASGTTNKNINVDVSTRVRFDDNLEATFGNSDDLKIYHDGTDSVIHSTTGKLIIDTPLDSSETIHIRGNSGEESIVVTGNGSVDLYYDNVKKFETTSAGGTVTGTLTATAFAGDGSALTGLAGIPTGVIVLWSGAANAIPSGYNLCDGTNNTPNLTERFIVGAGGGGNSSVDSSAYAVGATGGSSSVTLTTSQIPSHTHTVQTWNNASGPANHPQKVKTQAHYLYSNNQPGSFTSESTGGGGSHENRPPYYALCYIMKT